MIYAFNGDHISIEEFCFNDGLHREPLGKDLPNPEQGDPKTCRWPYDFTEVQWIYVCFKQPWRCDFLVIMTLPTVRKLISSNDVISFPRVKHKENSFLMSPRLLQRFHQPYKERLLMCRHLRLVKYSSSHPLPLLF